MPKERDATARPPLGPREVLRDDIEIRKPGGLHTLISVPDLANLVVRWPVQAHGNERDTMIVFRVERGEHLNSSDREGLGTGNAGLDLFADARLPGAAT